MATAIRHTRTHLYIAYWNLGFASVCVRVSVRNENKNFRNVPSTDSHKHHRNPPIKDDSQRRCFCFDFSFDAIRTAIWIYGQCDRIWVPVAISNQMRKSIKNICLDAINVKLISEILRGISDQQVISLFMLSNFDLLINGDAQTKKKLEGMRRAMRRLCVIIYVWSIVNDWMTDGWKSSK